MKPTIIKLEVTPVFVNENDFYFPDKYLPGKLYLVNEQHLVYVSEQKIFFCVRNINQFIVPDEKVVEPTLKNSTEKTDNISADTLLRILAIVTNKEKYREL